MIFNVPGHIDMIRNNTKTQTRRLKRGIYHVGKDYAVQSKRGLKAVEDIRIVMEAIWEEVYYDGNPDIELEELCHMKTIPISRLDANCEGYITASTFEELFKEINPKWDGRKRWAFQFYAIEVQK